MINIINIDKKAFEAFKRASKSTNEKEKNQRVNAIVINATDNNSINVQIVGSNNILSFPNKSGEKISNGDTVRIEYPSGSLSSGYIFMRLGSPVFQTGYQVYRYNTKQTHFPKIPNSNFNGIDTICDITLNMIQSEVVKIDLNLFTSFIFNTWKRIYVYIDDTLVDSYMIQSNAVLYYSMANLSFSQNIGFGTHKVSIKIKSYSDYNKYSFFEAINRGSTITVSGNSINSIQFSEMTEENVDSFSSYATEWGGTDYIYNYHGTNTVVITPSYAVSPSIKDNIEWTSIACTDIYFNNSLDGSQFKNLDNSACRSLDKKMIPSTAKYVVFEGGVWVWNNACQNNTNLELITCPLGFSYIGDYAFSGCTALKLISIKDTSTKIGDYAFQGCTSLSAVYIPKSVTSIGASAFAGTALTSIRISSTCTVGENAFPSGCTINYYS